MGVLRRGLLALGAALVMVVVAPGVAVADEPGESDEAKVLVLQAIALVVNTPDDMMAIEERIHDALEAPDKAGVDLTLVEQAAAALDGDDMTKTRDLLQSAIGAGPYVGTGVPEPVREASGEPGRPAFASGVQTGTTVVLDSFEPSNRPDGGDIVLLVLSGTAILLGAFLSWRLRPADTVRQLRRAAAAKAVS